MSNSTIVMVQQQEEQPQVATRTTTTARAGEDGPLLLDRVPSATLPPTAQARSNSNVDDDDDATVATLATEVGSLLRPAGDAFLKSETIFKVPQLVQLQTQTSAVSNSSTSNRSTSTRRSNSFNASGNAGGGDSGSNNTPSDESTAASSSTPSWKVVVLDPPVMAKKKKDKKLVIDSVEGDAFTLIEPGDVLRKVNGKRMTGSASYNAQRAMEYMQSCFDDQGVLTLTVGNEDGDDILVQARVTITQPPSKKQRFTYENMGLVVWWWGTLCVRNIEPNSVFSHTCLKTGDHVVSINDIDCSDRVTAEGFAHIVNTLVMPASSTTPSSSELTITVKRNKQRWSGKFG